MQTGGKILVIRGGAIGDFILTLPVLSALHEQFPHAGLELLGYPKTAQLALMGGLADQVRSIEAQPLAGFFARNGTLSPELQLYFKEFNIIISFLYDPDEIFQQNVRRCTSAQFIQGPHRPNEGESAHATEVFLKPLARLAIFGADPIPRLRLPPITKTRTIAVHPGSGSEVKNWPEAKWAALLNSITRQTDLRLLIVGGEAEEGRLQRLQKHLSSDRVELADNQPLPALAERLATCAGFIGHDSGITHLAAAVGLGGIVLWGPSKHEIWKPASPAMKILKHPSGLEGLPVEQVFSVFKSLAL